MTLKFFKFLAIALLVSCADAKPSGPAGIYVISNTRYVPGEVAKFNFDCVAGFSLRIPWTSIETWNATLKQPQYDFSRIDKTLEELRAIGKKMTLEIFVFKAPDYVLALPDSESWVNPHPRQGGIQPTPWNPHARLAYRNMLRAMSQHRVAGTNWTLSEHPSLCSVDAPIVGLQGLRELSNTLVKLPGYNRQAFIDSVLDCVEASRSAFPAQNGFLALFKMEDANTRVPLDKTIADALMAQYNQAGQPTLGFFQETLSDEGPNPTALGRLLKENADKTYIMFQALRPWALRDGEAAPRTNSSKNPVTGIRHAWKNYGSTYVELYGADILHGNHVKEIAEWNQFFLDNQTGKKRNHPSAHK
ncbi:MAG: hypothetical protein ACI81V_001419 [Lentimonas sp.]|jgi:hypothetical protein